MLPGKKRKAAWRIRKAAQNAYAVEELENRLLLSSNITIDSSLNNQVQSIKQDVDNALSTASGNTGLDSVIAPILSANDIPLIGPKLQQALGFLSNLTNTDSLDSKLQTIVNNDINSNTGGFSPSTVQNDVKNALGSFLAPAETADDLVRFFNSSGTDITDTGGAASRVQFNLDLQGTMSTPVTSPFNLGIPGIGLNVNGSVVAGITYTLFLHLGLDETSGFYLDVNPTDQDVDSGTVDPAVTAAETTAGTPPPIMQFMAGITLQGTGGAPFNGTATLGPLTLNVADHQPGTGNYYTPGVTYSDLTANQQKSTSFDAMVDLSLAGTGSSSMVSLSGLSSLTPTVTITGEAIVNLDLQISVANSAVFPSLSGLFHLDWMLPGVSLTTSGATDQLADGTNDVPSIGISDINLNLGTFISNTIAPVINDVYDIISPLSPLIELLDKPMPIFNDIGALKSQFPQTNGVVTIGDFFSQETGNSEVATILDVLNEIITLHGELSGSTPSGEYISLGSFNLQPTGGSTDPRKILGLSNEQIDAIGNTNAEQTFQNLMDAWQSGTGDALSDADPDPGGGNMGSATYELDFPLLEDPEQALNLFIGQNVPIFTFKASVNASFTLNDFFYILGPLGVSLHGTADNNNDAVVFNANFDCGYDTYGLTESTFSPLDGFYINTQDTSLTLNFGVAADAGLNVVIASGGVGGGINGTVNFNLDNGSTPDDEYRPFKQGISELGSLIQIYGTVTASLNAYISFGIGPFSYTHNFDLASVTLLSFGNPPPMPPPLGSVNANGLLLLYSGPNSSMQGNGESDGNDDFTVSHASTAANGTETVNVSAEGYAEQFAGVTEIYAEGGYGNNTFNIDQGVISAVDIFGGFAPGDNPAGSYTPGNNTIDDQGSGPFTLTAGNGNDQIRVNTENPAVLSQGGVVYAGFGNDLIQTDGPILASAENSIHGGSGDDTLIGGPGNDYIQAGNGNTLMDGGGGNNTLMGGEGNDQFEVAIADGGSNVIRGYPNPPAGAVNLLEVDGVGGAENITASASAGAVQVNAQYGSGASAGTDDVTATGIQAVDIEGAPSISGTPGAMPGNIDITVNPLNGTGVSAVYVDMLDSTNNGNLENPLNVTVDGAPAATTTLTGITTDVQNQNGNVLPIETAELYDISSDDSAGNLNIFAPVGSKNSLTYLAAAGSNTITVANTVETGPVTLQSAAGTSGTDTYDVNSVAGELTINQGGKNLNVSIGSPISGGLSTIAAPVMIADAVPNASQPLGFEGTIVLTINDATAIAGTSGSINSSVTGSVSGFGMGGDISWMYATSLDVVLGGSSNDANVALTAAIPTTIQAGNGGDLIQATPSDVPLTLLGGSGNDTIVASNNGDYISGGAGNDLLEEGLDASHGGADTIIGGAGNNQIVDNGASGVIYGNDTTADGVSGTNLITGTASAIINTGPGMDTVTFTGNAGDTVLAGGGNDSISVGGGADSISGAGGNDTISAGSGADTITANNGADSITAGSGNDSVSVGNGPDTISLADGMDTVQAGSGNDSITTGNGPDSITVTDGPGGRDTIAAGNGSDTISAGNGNDLISAGLGNDLVTAGSGNDTISLTQGNDTVSTGGGNDSITTGNGNDSITAAGGADTVFAGNGLDIITLGNGNDVITAGDGGDRITTGSGNSSITSGAGDDFIVAGNGNNTINSGAGDDVIDIGTGSDIVNGGTGNNTLIQSANTNQVLTDSTLTAIGTTSFQNIQLVSLSGQTANHSFDVSGWTNDGGVELTGGSGTNTVTDTNDYNFTLTDTSLSLSDGAVIGLSNIQNADLTGGSSPNTFNVSGWSGTATLDGDAAGAGLDVDTVIASANGNMTLTAASLTRAGMGVVMLIDVARAILTGDIGNLLLDASGFPGQATLVASAGNDTLLAGTGGDYLSGGTGHDSLVSTTGRDVIVATSGSGDTINAGTGGDIVYSTNPADVITGQPASLNPAVTPSGPTFTVPASTLPTGGDSSGPWAQDSGSASGGGVSSTTASATEPVVAAGSGAQYVAWADNRTGTSQIYVAEHVNGAWQELAGSAHGGGISNSAGNSVQPTIALDNSGNPIVAWTTYNGTSTDIQAADYNPSFGAWVALGTSLAAGGISDTGAASDPKIVETTNGPVVTWLDSSTGTSNVYAKAYGGGSWSALGSASGAGVTNSATSITQQSLATDGANIALAWTQTGGSNSSIYLLEYTGSSWNQVNGSNTGAGVSGSVRVSPAEPTVAFSGGSLYVAWQQTNSGQQSIVAATNAGGPGWQQISIDSPGSVPTTGTDGNDAAASDPQLSAGGSTIELTWTEAGLAIAPAFSTAIEANRFNGNAFVRELPGDAALNGINQSLTAVSSLALAVDPSGNPFVAWGDTSSGLPQVYFRGNTSSAPAVYYVNGPYSSTDQFTTASGSATNTGLSPSSPLNSVPAVMSEYSLAAGDVILVDSGSYAGFTVPAADSGISIVGAGGAGAHFTTTVAVSSAANVTLEGLHLDGGVSISSGTNIDIRNDSVAGASAGGGTNVRFEQDVITAGLTLAGGTASPYIEGNTIGGGLLISGAGATNVDITENTINGGVTLAGTTQSGTISSNNMTGGVVGLLISTPFSGSIAENEIQGAATGVAYNASAPLNANRIFKNTTGVTDSVNSSTGGLGFVGTSTPNNIFQNTTGVNLTGLMQNQHIYTNTTGVTGSGTLGGTSIADPNVIETNQTAVNFNGTVQYNNIDRNTTTIVVQSGQLIAHNVIFDNASDGLDVSAVSNVHIDNNTFYSATGDNVHLENASSDIELLNNIMASTGGYDLYVNSDSRTGFFSDYNDLYTTGTGKIVRWLEDFTDILDWQDALGEYDLHSIGTASINPAEGNPDLYQPTADNLQILPFVNGIRSTSPASGTADPAMDIDLPSSYQNLLQNPSFENGVTDWSVNTGGGTASGTPPAFDGTSYFYAGAVATGFAQQTVSLTGSGYTTGQIDGQTLALDFGGRIRAGVESIPSQGSITLSFLNGSGSTVGTPLTLNATNVDDRWELVSTRVNIPVGARSVTYQFNAVRETGTADDSYLDNAFVYVTPNTSASDMGANGYSPADVLAVKAAHLHLITPDLYVNWVLNSPHIIQWQSYGNSTGSNIDVSLYQNGQFLTTITSGTADTGSYSWVPASSGLTYGMHGLQIQISLVGNSAAYDRSTETFTIPENGTSFYVNGSSTANAQYTTVPGNDRNTGMLPSSPLPLVTTLLRTYSLGGTDSVYVDSGTYNDFAPVELSGNPAIGNGQGITILGPTNAGDVASIATLGFTGQPVIDVNDASYITLRNLSLTGGSYGVYIHGGSNNFTGSYLTATGNTLGGVRIESDSTGATFSYLTTSNNTGDGFYAGGVIVALTNSTSDNNTGDGFDLASSGGAVLTGDVAYNNVTGLYVNNNSGGATTTIGNANLALGLGNQFYNNARYGIDALGPALIAGNMVYGQTASGYDGILLSSAATATENIVYGNYNGIFASGASVSNNLIYNNANVGLEDDGSQSEVAGNVAYSNGVGIESNAATNSSPGPFIDNNLVYNNSTQGIWLIGGSAPTFYNNTVYQPAGDALRIDSGNPPSAGIRIENNILWAQNGYDIALAPQSETGFDSDFNDLYATGSGAVGLWNNIPESTLQNWSTASGGDLHSISANPLFVNTAAGDFHEQSTTGSYHGGSLAPVLGTAGLPIPDPGTLTPDANESPAIDRGDPKFAYSNEPATNGGYINLGTFGDTAQASLSPAHYLFVTSPTAGQTAVYGQPFTIAWRDEISNLSAGASQTDTIDLLQGSTVVQTFSAPDTGSYTWTPATSLPVGTYQIKIIRNDGTGLSATSASFSVAAFGGTFYVSASGSDSNSGLSPSAPKATIGAVLADYTLQPGNVIMVGAGTYTLSNNIALTAADSGITIEGVPGATIINRDDANSGAYAFDIQGAANITLENLSITGAYYGINASSGVSSAGLTVTQSTIYGNAEADIFLAGNNGSATITDNTFEGTSEYQQGFESSGNNVTVTGNTAWGLGYGVEILSIAASGTGIISGNTCYDNSQGIYAGAGSGVIGVTGNDLYDNYSDGLDLSGAGVTATGNTVYEDGKAGSNESTQEIGIYVSDCVATGNVVYGNPIGISVLDGGTASDNLIYNNSTEGVSAPSTSTIFGNVIYGCGWGISGGDDVTAENNTIYNNTTGGIYLTPSYQAQSLVLNNTVYQTAGDALNIVQATGTTGFRDNILWDTAGPDIAIDAASEQNVTGNYNDLYTSGSGTVGTFGPMTYATLSNWQNGSGLDLNSISANPLFVNLAGGDFHVQSLYGSNHGGTLAPILNTTTGLPQANPGTSGNIDANQSPTIDMGAPGDSYANEPAPNGGYVNLGSYGNTSQASLSPAHYLFVTAPIAGQTSATGQSLVISWRDEITNTSAGATKTDTIELVQGSTVVQTFSASDTGSYSWTPPTSIPAGPYQIEIIRNDGTGLSALSATFNLAAFTGTYYVSASGSDSNSGLDPAHPKADIPAILADYTMQPGNVIMAAAGTYNLSGNIVLSAADSGITIEGVAGQTILNRGSTSSTAYDIDVQDATNITLEDLTFTGAYYGINASSGENITGLTVTGSTFIENDEAQIYFAYNNGSATITNNTFEGSNSLYQQGVDNGGSATVITLTGNTAYGFGYGFEINAGGTANATTTISNNIAYDNTYGIYAYNQGSGSTNVTNNTAYNNYTYNFELNGSASSGGTGLTATGNTAYENGSVASKESSGEIGILIGTGAVASNNIAYGNVIGVEVSTGTISGNQVYSNTTYGVDAVPGTDNVTGNTVYSNGTWGIYGSPSTVSDNIVYGNNSGGIYLSGDYTAQILNNTVYQTTGDAFRLDGLVQNGSSPPAIIVQNNIFWTTAGPDILCDDPGEESLSSDYNDLYATGNGEVAEMAGANFTSLAAWVWELGLDQHSMSANPQFDSLTGTLNFQVQPTSPTIDAGNPASAYSLEPGPNGGRINLGNYGDTALATPSASQVVQVLYPNGLQKLQVGTSYTITWHTSGFANGTTANVDLSLDGGNTWTNLATNVAMTGGNGSLSWAPTTASSGNTAEIRITANSGSDPYAISSQPFSIAPAGNIYYVNGSSTVGAVYTTAVGNNANNGKTPATPMASIEAVLNDYQPGAGDVIEVDTGTYTLFHNINLATINSGLTITGPVTSGVAVLNRNSENAEDDVFALESGVSNVTIEYLSITGAATGIYAQTDNNNGVTIADNQIYANDGLSGGDNGGIYAMGPSSNWAITGNSIHDNTGENASFGISLFDMTATISNNIVYNETKYDIDYSATNSARASNVITANTVYGSQYGIYADNATVSSNLAHDNTIAGIYADSGSLLTGNTVWRQTTTNAYGIEVTGSGGAVTLDGNHVFGNYLGVYVNGAGAFGNAGAIMDGNYIYSNVNYGVELYQASTADLYNNLVYANSTGGIYVTGATKVTLQSNTVFQLNGDAINLSASSTTATISDNVLWAVTGYDLDVASTSQTGLSSNYNILYHPGNNANVGLWNGTAQATLAAWKTASGQDSHSSEANPDFVDPAGADAVLGYNAAANNGAGYNGGSDDNFSLSAASPAIASGTASGAPTVDILGQTRINADMGAYAFLGSQSTTPPMVTATTPAGIGASGSINPVSSITVTFSGPLDVIDARAPGEYQLLDDTTGTTYSLTPQYTPGSTQVVLSIAGGVLSAGSYTFTIYGTDPSGLHDVSGNLLDGNGTAGTNYVSTFIVVAPPQVTGVSPSTGPTSGGTAVTITGMNFTGTTAVTFGGVPATGITVNQAGTQITAIDPAVTTAGMVDVLVTTPGGTSTTSTADQFTYTSTTAPTVVSVTTNDGEADGNTAQASEVRQLVVTFSEAVNLTQPGAFSLGVYNLDGTGGAVSGNGANDGSITNISSVLNTATTTNGGLTWTITFAPSTANTDASASMIDGIYSFSINNSDVTSNGVALTGSNTYTFHRLYGDITGTGAVNNTDARDFSKAYGTAAGSANYNAALDYGGAGANINNTDARDFSLRYGQTFSSALPAGGIN